MSDNSPASIITDAYFDAGLLQEGESLTSEQQTTGLRKLTDMVNLWQTQGLKLWLNADLPITLVVGQNTYTLGPAGSVAMIKPLRVLDGWYADAKGVRRPLSPLGWADYIRLSQINQRGAINSYFVDKQQTQLSVFLWQAPDAQAATGVAHLLIQNQITMPISLTSDMNFPIEWRIALRWGLADEICTGQPQAIMDRCQQRASQYRMALEDWDVEDAPTRVAPDPRQSMYSGSFR